MGRKELLYADIMDVHLEVTGSGHIVPVRLPNGKKFQFLAVWKPDWYKKKST